MITQYFDLNLIPNSAPVIIHVDQFDHGEGRLVATLYEDSEPYIPTGALVYIQGVKPDGKFFVRSEGISISENIVTANLEEVMTQVPGKTRAQFVVVEPNGRTGTFVFWIDVQLGALPQDVQLSESDMQLIQEAIEKAGEAAESAEQAEDSAEAAAGSATAAATSETNAANSASAAAGSATAAAASETNAANSASAAAGSATAAAASETNAANSASAAAGSATAAAASETNAENYAEDAHGWADNNGDSGSDAYSATNNAYYWAMQAKAAGGVRSFNGRTGSVLPVGGDYTAQMISYSQSQTMKEKIDQVAGTWTTPVSCLVGDTTVTISDASITTGSTIIPYSETSSGEPVGFSKIAVSTGQAVITFSSALTEACSVKLHIV